MLTRTEAGKADITEDRVTSHPEAGAALAIYIVAGAVIRERSEEAGATQLPPGRAALPEQTLPKGATKSDQTTFSW